MSSENKPKSQFQIRKELAYEKLISSLKLSEKKIDIIIVILILVALILIFVNKR